MTGRSLALLAASLISATAAAEPPAKPVVDKALEQARARMRELHNALVTDNVKLARAQLAATVAIDGLQFSSDACQTALGIRQLKAKRVALAKCLDDLVPSFVWTIEPVTATATGFTTTVEGNCIAYTFELQRKAGLIAAIRRAEVKDCAQPGDGNAGGGIARDKPDGPLLKHPTILGPELPKLPRPEVMPASLQRISGDRNIVPDEETKAAMRKAGKRNVSGMFELCLDEQAAVTVEKVHSTGYPEYDRKIEQRMRQWKYRPYVIYSRVRAVCAGYTINYSLDNADAQ